MLRTCVYSRYAIPRLSAIIGLKSVNSGLARTWPSATLSDVAAKKFMQSVMAAANEIPQK